MQIISFNSHGSKILRGEDSRALRIAYLLGDNILIAGSIVYDFSFKKIIPLIPFKQQLNFLETALNDNSAAGKKQFDEIRKLRHIYNTTKNKTPQLVAAYKKVEFNYTKMYKSISQRFFEKILSTSGFTDMKDLIDEKIMQVSITGLRYQEKPDKKEIKASEILNLDFKKEFDHKIFIIGNQFFEKPFVNSFDYVDLDNEAAANKDKVFIQPLLKIPNITGLKSTELKLIRNSLSEIRATLNGYINEWINACFINESFAQKKELIQTKLLPLAVKLNEQLNTNPNIEHIAKLTNMEEVIEIFIGEIPFQLLLDYNLHYKIIGEDTLEQIKILRQNDERFNRRWPVLIYRSADAKNINLEFDNIKNDGESIFIG